MKRALTFLTFFALLIAMPSALLAQSAPIVGSGRVILTPSASTVSVNGTVTVAVNIDVSDVTGTSPGGTPTPAVLGAYDIHVNFDKSRLRLDNVWGGVVPEFSGKPIFTSLDQANADGVVSVAAWHTSQNSPTGLLHVANLMFTAVSAGVPVLVADVDSLSTASQRNDINASTTIPATGDSTSITIGTPRSVSGAAALALAYPSSVNENGALNIGLSVDLTGVSVSSTAGPLAAVLGAYQIEVTFDPARVHLDAVSGGNTSGFIRQPTTTNLTTANNTGHVTISDAQTDPNSPTGLVNIASLIFTAKSAGAAVIAVTPISLSSGLQNGEQPASIPSTGITANVTIGGSGTVDGIAALTLPLNVNTIGFGASITSPLRIDLRGVRENGSPSALGGYQVEVVFDNNFVILSSVGGGTSPGFTGTPSFTGCGGSCDLNTANTNGRIRFAAAQTGSDPTGIVHVATLTFTAKNLAGVTNINITPLSISTPVRSGTALPISGSGIGSRLSIVAPPSITGISPLSTCQGGADFVINITGSDFKPGAQVVTNRPGTSLLNPTPADTTFIDSTHLRATIRTSELVTAGTSIVRVMNPDGILSNNSQPLTINADSIPPVVSAPPAIDVMQTTCDANGDGAATGGTSAALASWLNNATATDGCSVTLTALVPQSGGSNVTNATVFRPASVGCDESTSICGTQVTFRYRDNANNIGSAISTIKVRLYADLDRDNQVNAVDFVIMANYLVDNLAPSVAPFKAPLSTADVNHDSKVDAVDFVLVANYLVHNVTCLAP